MNRKPLNFIADGVQMKKLDTKFMNTVFLFLVIAFFCIQSAASLSSSNGSLFVDDNCVFSVENPFDVETENGNNSFVWRSYPLLNCTEFTKSNFSNQHFNTTVYGILIQDSEMREIQVDDFMIFSELHTMEFRNNHKLNSFVISNSTVFDNVVSLAITSSQLNSIPSQLLKSLPHLTRLIILSSNIIKIDGDAFSCCPKLQSLSLDHNAIQHLNTSWLISKPTIQRLSLRKIGLKNIDTCFKPARNLQFLDLADNNITVINLKSFRKAANLNTLILANNKISEIHPKAFKGTINLRYIDLSNNFIKTLHSGTFSYSFIDDLNVVLWENPINCDCNLKWLKTWMEQVSDHGRYPDISLKCYNPARNHGKTLTSTPDDKSLSSDDLTCLPHDRIWKNLNDMSTTTQSFISSQSVKHSSSILVNMSEPTVCAANCRSYSSITDYFLQHHQTVQTFRFPVVVCINTTNTNVRDLAESNTRSLIVSDSTWEEVDVGNLWLPDRLTDLVLKKNQIKQLLPNPNVRFGNLRVLSLQSNLITSISKAFLASFPNLNKLKIFNNRITYFSDDLFIYNRLLTKVFLGPNPLQQQFTGNCLNDLSALVTVGLRGMNLKTIPSSIGSKVHLMKVDLSDNHLTNVSRNAFWNCSSLTDISLENNRIGYMDSMVFHNNLYLRTVDLSENEFTSISSEWFSKNKDLSHVELWQNPIRCDCKIHSFVKWIKQMEYDNPSTEIRFRCEEPFYMRGKTSDETSPDEYKCGSSDGDHENSTENNTRLYKPSKNTCDSTWTIIIITVIATAMCCAMIVIAARMTCTFCAYRFKGKLCCQRFNTYSVSETTLSDRPVNMRLLEENVGEDAL